MSKKIPAIKALPNGQAPDYGISGVTPEQETYVRGMISDMAPDAYPYGIAFVPADQFKKTTNEIARTGMFGGMQVGRGEGAQESFGSQGSTHIADGFSIRPMRRIWINGDDLNDPKRLQGVLAHEMGHMAAKDASEDAADHIKDTEYLPRMKAQQQLSDTVMHELPLRTSQPILGSALPPEEPTETAQGMPRIQVVKK